MKTIEERAKDCVRHLTQGWVLEAAGEQLEALFIAGAESERAELTRWNDPKKELPPIYENVMVKYKASDGCEHITIAWRSAGDAGGYIYAISGTGVTINSQNILGWREIQE